MKIMLSIHIFAVNGTALSDLKVSTRDGLGCHGVAKQKQAIKIWLLTQKWKSAVPFNPEHDSRNGLKSLYLKKPRQKPMGSLCKLNPDSRRTTTRRNCIWKQTREDRQHERDKPEKERRQRNLTWPRSHGFDLNSLSDQLNYTETSFSCFSRL